MQQFRFYNVEIDSTPFLIRLVYTVDLFTSIVIVLALYYILRVGIIVLYYTGKVVFKII